MDQLIKTTSHMHCLAEASLQMRILSNDHIEAAINFSACLYLHYIVMIQLSYWIYWNYLWLNGFCIESRNGLHRTFTGECNFEHVAHWNQFIRNESIEINWNQIEHIYLSKLQSSITFNSLKSITFISLTTF